MKLIELRIIICLHRDRVDFSLVLLEQYEL